MVEHAIVNRRVGGSSPSSGAKKKFRKTVDGSVGRCKLLVFFRCIRGAMAAQRPFKPLVVDSNSTGCTNFCSFKFLSEIVEVLAVAF